MNLIKIRFQWILGRWQASYVGGQGRFTFGNGHDHLSALADLVSNTKTVDFKRIVENEK